MGTRWSSSTASRIATVLGGGIDNETQDGAEQIHTRLRDLDDWKIRINWVGAGLVGLIALLAATGSDYPAEPLPSILRALAITLIVISGGLLAYARVNFEWAASKIEHELKLYPELRETDGIDRLPDEEMRAWPTVAAISFTVALLLILLSGASFILAVWWGVITSLC